MNLYEMDADLESGSKGAGTGFAEHDFRLRGRRMVCIKCDGIMNECPKQCQPRPSL